MKKIYTVLDARRAEADEQGWQDAADNKAAELKAAEKELLQKPLQKELLRSRRNGPVLLNAPLKKPVLQRKLLQRPLQHQPLWYVSVLFSFQDLLTKRSARIDWHLCVPSLGRSLANC